MEQYLRRREKFGIWSIFRVLSLPPFLVKFPRSTLDSTPFKMSGLAPNQFLLPSLVSEHVPNQFYPLLREKNCQESVPNPSDVLGFVLNQFITSPKCLQFSQISSNHLQSACSCTESIPTQSKVPEVVPNQLLPPLKITDNSIFLPKSVLTDPKSISTPSKVHRFIPIQFYPLLNCPNLPQLRFKPL